MSLLYERSDLAYLLLTEAVEAVATQIIDATAAAKAIAPSPPGDYQRRAAELGVTAEHARELYFFGEAKKRGPTYQFRAFLQKFTPQRFWRDEDDVFHFHRYRGMQPKAEKFDKTVRLTYSARSDFVHAGTPYPGAIRMGLGNMVDARAADDALAQALEGGTRMPPFVWFERLAQSAILESLRQTAQNASPAAGISGKEGQ